MKKVIDGLRYDTEKATEVACWCHGYPGDYGRCEETLYRTVSGKYFLHGKGGAASKWREQIGQSEWGGGEEILAKTPEEALSWLEEHGKDVPEGCPEIVALVKDA